MPSWRIPVPRANPEAIGVKAATVDRVVPAVTAAAIAVPVAKAAAVATVVPDATATVDVDPAVMAAATVVPVPSVRAAAKAIARTAPRPNSRPPS